MTCLVRSLLRPEARRDKISGENFCYRLTAFWRPLPRPLVKSDQLSAVGSTGRSPLQNPQRHKKMYGLSLWTLAHT